MVQVPGAIIIKLFNAEIFKWLYLAWMLFPGRPFQPSLMFVDKAKSLPLKDLHSSRLRPYSQTLDKAEKACQWQTFINYSRKKFYGKDPGGYGASWAVADPSRTRITDIFVTF